MTNIRSGSFELSLSIVVVVFLSFVYIVYEFLAEPAGGHPFGHSLGILGALLMVSTEVLYSARKRWRFFSFGQTRHWLSFHIFTGIVGPALVVMHTGLQFRGLAGLTMGLTFLVVASGFLGRYIYTAVPRTLAGIEIDRRTLEDQAEHQRRSLSAWKAGKSRQMQAVIDAEMHLSANSKSLSPLELLTWRYREWREQRRLHAMIQRLEKAEQEKLGEIERLLRRQRRLTRQINSLQVVRRMMGWWHTFHVPLGLTLFTSMTIHIVASLYYKGI